VGLASGCEVASQMYSSHSEDSSGIATDIKQVTPIAN